MLNQILLEPEQQELLVQLVEAMRNLPREQREKFMLSQTNMGDFLHQKGLPSGNIEVYAGDLEVLAHNGLVNLSYGSRGSELYDVTPHGSAYYTEFKQRSGEPVTRVEAEIHHYLDSRSFEQSYPVAYRKWTEAEQLLWQSDSPDQLTTIGHLCRETIQAFATELIQQYHPPDPDPNVQHDVARVRAILNQRKEHFGDAEGKFLDALLAYWGTLSDLIQRQEHGAQKEGEPLSLEDARRVVFQTAVVIFEFDRSLSRGTGRRSE